MTTVPRPLRRTSLALTTLAALLVAGCAPGEGPARPAGEERAPLPVVRTLSFPADGLVARLAGELVDAECVLPPGEDAPYWQPPAELVASLADADLIVANGAGFERWIETASLPEERLVVSASTLDLIEIPGVKHSHGPGGEHTHGGVDPHTWSDPLAYLEQARVVADGLALLVDEEGQRAIEANLDALRFDLEALDAAYAEAFAPLAGVPMAANHPSFNYLAQRYGLDVEAFELDPERVPDPGELAPFEAWAEGRDAPLLLWEAPPTDEVRAAFDERVRHVVLDPLEQPGASGSYDYLAQARGNVGVFAALEAE